MTAEPNRLWIKQPESHVLRRRSNRVYRPASPPRTVSTRANPIIRRVVCYLIDRRGRDLPRSHRPRSARGETRIVFRPFSRSSYRWIYPALSPLHRVTWYDGRRSMPGLWGRSKTDGYGNDSVPSNSFSQEAWPLDH